jgi:hypothetical protein
MPSIDRQIAFGMSTVRYRTTPDKADLIENLIITGDGTLCSMTGPTVYEPRHVYSKAPVDLGQIHSVFHGYFDAGEKEVLLVHGGTNLWYHVGAKKGWVALSVPRTLTNDTENTVYSFFEKFAEMIIFSDGAGPPLVIDKYLTVHFLGFADIPAPPVVKGPDTVPSDKGDNYDEGSVGYSWPGGLGSSSRRLRGNRPYIEKGTWRWCLRYQDSFGNYSALSRRSVEVEYGPRDTEIMQRAQIINLPGASGATVAIPKRVHLKVKDLRRAAAILMPATVPENCQFIEIGRTKDTERNETDFYYVARRGVPGGVVHDYRKDAGLTRLMPRTAPVPVMESALVDNGRLMVLSGAYVYLSQPGFPGTYNEEDKLMLTADGQEGTAIFSLTGKRYASTKYSIIDVTDLTNPIAVTNLVGIAGPKAWAYLPGEAGIVFVSMSGVYSLANNNLTKLSDDISYFWDTEINKPRLKSAVVWYSLKRKEIRIAVTPSGDISNKLIIAYSELGWRTYRIGVSVNCFAYIDEMEAIGGNDSQTRTGQYTAHDVYVLEKESPVYTPPARQAIYESDYIPLDESLGFVRGKVLTMYFGFVETYAGEGAAVDYEINYDTGIAENHSMRLEDAVGVGIMDNEERRHSWGTFKIDTDTFHEKRKVYRKARIDLTNANRFKFTLKATYPIMVELVDFIIEFNVDSSAGVREVDVVEV